MRNILQHATRQCLINYGAFARALITEDKDVLLVV
jgi:hypothetical protein